MSFVKCVPAKITFAIRFEISIEVEENRMIFVKQYNRHFMIMFKEEGKLLDRAK